MKYIFGLDFDKVRKEGYEPVGVPAVAMRYKYKDVVNELENLAKEAIDDANSLSHIEYCGIVVRHFTGNYEYRARENRHTRRIFGSTKRTKELELLLFVPLKKVSKN